MTPKQPILRTSALGQLVTRTRESKGMTIYQLSKESGIVDTTIKNIEKGRDIRISTLFLIANALNITNDQLLIYIRENRYSK